MPHLLLDFGTTSTKGALVDLDTGVFSRVRHHPAIPALPAAPGRYEVPLAALHERFHAICAEYHDAGGPLEGIHLASEMHGFAVLDAHGRPATPYVSWRDERALEPVDGIDTFTLVSRATGPAFRAITGMRPRPGFPLMGLVHLARTSGLPDAPRVVSLPDWLALASGEGTGHAHPTMLAGMAFHDVAAGTASADLLALVRELTGRRVHLHEPAPEGAVAGHWRHRGCRVPIHVGIGDHQCAALGAGLAPGNAISVNLGTGSQVAVADRVVAHEAAEIRPYFGGGRLATITHVPGGRVVAEHVAFLTEVARAAGAPAPDFWARLAAVGAADVDRATLAFDLALFRGALGYRDGGRIAAIHEGTLTLPNYLASLVRALVRQYVDLLQVLDPARALARILVSGGLAGNLPAIPGLLARATGYETLPPTALDESLLGLRALALVATGRADGYRAAQAAFGRACRVEQAGPA